MKNWTIYALCLLLYWATVTIVYPSLLMYSIGLFIFYYYYKSLNPFLFLPFCGLPYVLPSPNPSPQPIIELIMISLLLLMLYPAARDFWDKRENPERKISLPLFLLAASAAYGLTIVVTCVRLHHNFMTGQWDLAVFDNIFYNMISGNGLANPLERNRTDITHLHVHFSPSLMLLAPLYALMPRAETLSAIQALTIPIGALSIFYIGKKLSATRTGFVLAICWILYWPMQGGLFFHFHEMAFAPSLLMALGATLIYNYRIAPWAIFFAMLGIKEDFGLIALPALLFFGYWSKRWKVCITMAILTLIYATSVKYFWTMEHGENWMVYYSNLGVETVPELIKLIITSPYTILEKGLYAEKNLRGLLEVLTPLAFLSLTTPWGFFLLTGPILVLYSAHQTTLASNHLQYTFYIAGFIFLGALEALRNKTHLNAKLTICVLATLITQWNYGIINPKELILSGSNKFTVPSGWGEREKYKELQEIIGRWDKNVSIMAENTITPHISNRERAFSLGIAYMEKEDWQAKKTLGRHYSEMPEFEKPEVIITYKNSPMIQLIDPIRYKKDSETKYFAIFAKR